MSAASAEAVANSSVAQRIKDYQLMARRMFENRYDSPSKCVVPTSSRSGVVRSALDSFGEEEIAPESDEDSAEEEEASFVAGEEALTHRERAELEVSLHRMSELPDAGGGGEVVINQEIPAQGHDVLPLSGKATMRSVGSEAIPCKGQEFALRGMLLELKALYACKKERDKQEKSTGEPLSLSLEGWRARFLANGSTSVGMNPSVLTEPAQAGEEEADYTVVCTMVPIAYFFVRLCRTQVATCNSAALYVFVDAMIKSVPK